MFLRFLAADGQCRSARTVELFGYLDFTLGIIILVAPFFVEGLLHLPTLSPQGANYLRLVGLLVSGLGMLYIVSGRLNARGFVFASLLDRPVVPLVMLILWRKGVIPGPLALAFSVSDFGGFLWTLAAWRAEVRMSHPQEAPGVESAAELFGFISGVVRNARTFHPDGRVFLGAVRSLKPADPALARAAERLAGSAALLRMGMGIMKRGMPRWLSKAVPDAPSIAVRIFSPATSGEIHLERRTGEDLDLLCTAGGDRLWKLILNLATGGLSFGLHRFDYFRNTYYSDVPYVLDPDLKAWLRLSPAQSAKDGAAPKDAAGREAELTDAVARNEVLRIEAQRAGGSHEEFLPFAEIRFEREIDIDQEALHFEPFAGRGFLPYGFLTTLRSRVYPASVMNRGASKAERAQRENDSFGTRVSRFLRTMSGAEVAHSSSAVRSDLPAGAAPGARRRPLLKAVGVVAIICVLLLVVYLAVRLTSDRPVEYADDVMHYKYGSTGGERTMGIPYWFWVALPDLFPEYLPDHQAGHGYKSFGMIYEDGKDPRYALPVGVSMRHFRGIDVVYLNCAVCHTGTVRDRPGAEPTVITGMPAQGLNLGAFEQFLTTIPLDQKFIPRRMLDQIDAMSGSPERRVAKPDVLNRLIFRYYAVQVMRERMLMLRQRLGFIHAETWGPGRVDTFNAPKALLNFNMTHADAKELMGNADFPSIWNQGPRQGMQLHWDGNNTSVDERNLSAAFGTGAYPPTLDAKLVERTARWLLTAKPPAYPYPIDIALAQAGAPVYASRCAGCHGTRDAPFRTPSARGYGVGTVVPINEIATDRARLDSYTYLLAANQGTLYAGYEKDWGFSDPYPQRFSHFHKTGLRKLAARRHLASRTLSAQRLGSQSSGVARALRV